MTNWEAADKKKLFLNIFGLLVVILLGLVILYIYLELGAPYSTMVYLLLFQIAVIGGGFILKVLGRKCIRAYKIMWNKCKERKVRCCKKKEIIKEDEKIKVVNKNTKKSQKHQRGRDFA